MSATNTPAAAATTHTGRCHCGAVRFEADLDLGKPLSRCNCSLCARRGVTAAMVAPAAFRLLTEGARLGEYPKNPVVGSFLFCADCGVHVFGRGNLPELGGAYVAVNVNCIDALDPETLTVIYWDGRHNNWDAGPRDRPWPIAA